MKIKLTESKLKQIVAESVQKVLRENSFSHLGIADDELVKIAEKGDYVTACIEYLKEGWDDPSSAPSLKQFIQYVRNQEIRYLEDENGIYYINDWNG